MKYFCKVVLRNWAGQPIHTWLCQGPADLTQGLKEFANIIEIGDTITCEECKDEE